MPWRKLDEIIVDFRLNPRTALDRTWVAELGEALEDLPPIVVMDTDEGEYLVDGFHRYYAHLESGHEEIEIEQRVGTLDEARDLALALNLTHGKKLTPREREKAILGYKDRHPRLSAGAIAARLGLSRRTVERIFRLQEQAGETLLPLPREHELMLVQSRLTREQKEKLRAAARKGHWTARQVRDAVKTLESSQIAEAYKRAVLEGQAEPVTFTRTGEPAFTPSQLTEAAAREIQVCVHRALRAMDALALVQPRDLLAALGEHEAFELLDHLYRLESWVSEVRSCLSDQLPELWGGDWLRSSAAQASEPASSGALPTP